MRFRTMVQKENQTRISVPFTKLDTNRLTKCHRDIKQFPCSPLNKVKVHSAFQHKREQLKEKAEGDRTDFSFYFYSPIHIHLHTLHSRYYRYKTTKVGCGLIKSDVSKIEAKMFVRSFQALFSLLKISHFHTHKQYNE